LLLFEVTFLVLVKSNICEQNPMMTKLLEKEPVELHCQHCSRQIESAWVCKIDSFIGIRYAYLCDNCQKLLGIVSAKDYTLLKTTNPLQPDY
jgi:hypothetical protein